MGLSNRILDNGRTAAKVCARMEKEFSGKPGAIKRLLSLIPQMLSIPLRGLGILGTATVDRGFGGERLATEGVLTTILGVTKGVNMLTHRALRFVPGMFETIGDKLNIGGKG